MNVIIDSYFHGQSWPEMVREDRSQSDARSDLKCGLAVLHCRYGFIGYLKKDYKFFFNKAF